MIRGVERFVHPIVVLDTTPFPGSVYPCGPRLIDGVPSTLNNRELYTTLRRSFWRMRVGTYNGNMSVYVKMAVASRWDGNVYV